MNQYPSNPNRFCTQCGILCHIKLNKLITTMIIIGMGDEASCDRAIQSLGFK